MAKESATITGKMSQAEINVIEEELSTTFGKTPREFGGHLVNRFEKINAFIKKEESKLIYVERRFPGQAQQEERTVETKKILAEVKALKEKRESLVMKWTQRVMEYIKSVYGEERRENGILVGYGDRIEIQRKTHLKKLW